MAYTFPQVPKPPKLGKKKVLLVANGDLRIAANQKCWPAQAEMEAALTRALTACAQPAGGSNMPLLVIAVSM